MSKKEKVLNFVKKHKKELAIATIAVVGGVVVFAITKKKPKMLDDNLILKGFVVGESSAKMLDIPENLTNNVSEISELSEGFDVWIDRVPITELGVFGEKLMKVEGLKPDMNCAGVVSFEKLKT